MSKPIKENWRQRYLHLITYLANVHSILVEYCPKCDKVVSADHGRAEDIYDDGECWAEITYTCPHCNHVWYV